MSIDIVRTSEEYRRGFKAGMQMILNWIDKTSSDADYSHLKSMIVCGLALHDELQKEIVNDKENVGT